MFALFVTAKIKAGHRAEFIEATMGDAVGSNNDEPGCLQFDVHAD
ncbi:MAG: antibiotic biosynthesis monooxygenase, partial [SAR202 cluster bacterium]|nr:antibiotic biosynthesis monooxygenase [SAR202 cluster bacterium]